MTRDAFLLNVDSPVGPFGVEGDERRLTALYLPAHARPGSRGTAPAAVAKAAAQLVEYFAGARRRFSVTLAPVEATSFQHDVWRALSDIPYGEVRTYGEIAADVARPLAHRAVGNANHANPYPVIVPCHRVVASNGLGGYGGGEDVKRYLLALEGVHY